MTGRNAGLLSGLRQFVPKLYWALREGYTIKTFGADALAGLTVAIIALPLATALAIASGATPEKGIITAIVAGLVISLLGGSSVQIGGPTGAFVVVVFNVIAQHGYDGLAQATFMAGLILAVAGILRLGAIIKFMPQPVVTGFTSGIAVIIFSSQIKDFFGLALDKMPADFWPKWTVMADNASTLSPATLAVGLFSLIFIVALRRLTPKLPAFLIAIGAASALVFAFQLPVDTIGSRFGDLPNALPVPHLPAMEWGRLRELMPSAFTIAFLAGIEALLSAVVADGLTGKRHSSNGELLAQGLANCASVMFGGLPATGAIARTATNVRSGGKTPVSGIMHAVFMMAFMYFMAPFARHIPLASLAAVLILVSWNMAEFERFRQLLRGPRGDGGVLVMTFLLTVMVDLTLAIEVGVVFASLLFMYRMTHAVEIENERRTGFSDDTGHNRRSRDREDIRHDLPKDVEVFRFRGPLFFGVVSLFADVAETVEGRPRAYILDMTDVPMIDVSGASALHGFIEHCRKRGIHVLIAGLKGRPRQIAQTMGIAEGCGFVRLFDLYSEAVTAAKA